ncbi:hypothetical protein TNCV_2312911 [Trichonephila clavipes]|nr:hypothetical protein TNCV_2312911 [Trichonephila clavipes]
MFNFILVPIKLDKSQVMNRYIIILENPFSCRKWFASWDGRDQLNFSILLPKDPFFQRYCWFCRKPRHGCPYQDRTTSMLDNWKETITIVPLCRHPSKVDSSCCRGKCERETIRQTILISSTYQSTWFYTVPLETFKTVVFKLLQLTEPLEQEGVFLEPLEQGVFLEPLEQESVFLEPLEQESVFLEPEEQEGIFVEPLDRGNG